MRRGTDRQTHTHRRPWPIHVSPELHLTRNVINAQQLTYWATIPHYCQYCKQSRHQTKTSILIAVKTILSSTKTLYSCHLSGTTFTKPTSALQKAQYGRWIHSWMECLCKRQLSFDAACAVPACHAASAPAHLLISQKTLQETLPCACHITIPTPVDIRQKTSRSAPHVLTNTK